MPVTFYSPSSFQELKNLKLNRFLVKVSSPSCPPCKLLHQFLKDYSAEKEIPVISINTLDQNELYLDLKAKYKFKSVPFWGIFDSDLKDLDGFHIGFRKENVEEVLKKL